MGRAIDVQKDLDKLKAEVQTLKTAFEGLASTVDTLKDTAPAKENIDLHEKPEKHNIKAESKKNKKTELATEEA
jgi:hypothetical protein